MVRDASRRGLPFDPEAAPGAPPQDAAGACDLMVIGAENRAIQHRLFFGYDNERLIGRDDVTVVIVVPRVTSLR